MLEVGAGSLSGDGRVEASGQAGAYPIYCSPTSMMVIAGVCGK